MSTHKGEYSLYSCVVQSVDANGRVLVRVPAIIGGTVVTLPPIPEDSGYALPAPGEVRMIAANGDLTDFQWAIGPDSLGGVDLVSIDTVLDAVNTGVPTGPGTLTRPGVVTTQALADASVTTVKIADYSVTAAKLAVGAVTVAAADVSVVPSGTIASTDVQAALSEVAGDASTEIGNLSVTLTAGINLNTANITTLDAAVAANEGAIILINGQVVQLDADTTAALAGKLAIGDAAADINSHTTLVNGAKILSSLGNLDTVLAANDTSVTTLQTELNTAEAALVTAQNDINTAEADILAAQGNISTLQTELNTAEASLATAQTNITNLQSGLSTNDSALAQAQTDINAAEADIVTAQANIASNSSNISTLQTELNTAEASLATAQTNITNLQSGLGVNDAALAQAQIDIDAVPVGGNMVVNGGFEAALAGTWRATSGLVTAVRSTTTSKSGTASGKVTINSGVGAAIEMVDLFSVTPSMEYVFSLWMYHDLAGATQGTHYVRMTRFDAAGAYLGLFDFRGNQPNSGVNVWTKFEYAYTMPSDTYRVRFQIFNYDNSTGALYIDDVDFRPRVTTVQIQDGAITAEKVTANAIIAGKIAANAVTAATIAAGAITTPKLAAGAVTANEIGAGAITAVKIDAGAVTADAIAANAITAVKVAAGAITSSKLSVVTEGANLVVAGSFGGSTAAQEDWCAWAYGTTPPLWTIATSTGSTRGGRTLIIDASVSDGAVSRAFPVEAGKTYALRFREMWAAGTGVVYAGVYSTLTKPANGFVDTNNRTMPTAGWSTAYVGHNNLSKAAGQAWQTREVLWTAPDDASGKHSWASIVFLNYSASSSTYEIDWVELVPQATTIQLADGAITADKIAVNAITAAKIAAGTITATEIAAGAITTPKLAAGAVTANEIGAGAVTAVKIAANTITAAQIAAGTITAAEIAAGAITASKLAIVPTGGNLVLNGDFEAADFAGTWEAFDGDAIATRSTAASKGGAASAKLTVVTGLGGGLRNVGLTSVVPGQEYVYSVWLYHDLAGSTPGTHYVRLQRFNAAGTVEVGFIDFRARVSNSTISAWTKFEYAYTVPADTYKIRLVFYNFDNSTGALYVDDVDFRPRVGSVLIQDGAILADKIAANAVVAGKIAANAVTATTIAAGSVIAGKIGAGAIVANDIAATTITGDKLAANTITANEIAAGAIGANKLAVTRIGANLVANSGFEDADFAGTWGYVHGDITNGYAAILDATAPEGSKVGRVPSDGLAGMGSRAFPVTPGSKYRVRARVKHANGSGTHWLRVYQRSTYPTTGDFVTSGEQEIAATDLIASTANTGITAWTQWDYVYTAPAGAKWVSLVFLNWDTPTGVLLVDDIQFVEQFAATNISDGIITTDKIAANAITAVKIAANTITGDRIAANTIAGGNIIGLTITAAEIGSQAITAAKIAAAVIEASHIASSTITGSNIAAGTITGNKLVAGTIEALQIAANTITTAKLDANAIQSTNYSYVSGNYTAAGSRFDLANGTIRTPGLYVNGASPYNVAVKGDITAKTLSLLAADGVTPIITLYDTDPENRGLLYKSPNWVTQTNRAALNLSGSGSGGLSVNDYAQALVESRVDYLGAAVGSVGTYASSKYVRSIVNSSFGTDYVASAECITDDNTFDSLLILKAKNGAFKAQIDLLADYNPSTASTERLIKMQSDNLNSDVNSVTVRTNASESLSIGPRTAQVGTARPYYAVYGGYNNVRQMFIGYPNNDTIGFQTGEVFVAADTGNLVLQSPTRVRVSDERGTGVNLMADAWSNVVFVNNYSNFGGGFQTVQYRKHGETVQVRGMIRRALASGVQYLTMFTLPAGYRPPASLITACMCYNPFADGTTRAVRTDVGSNGIVNMEPWPGAGFWMFFDISFSVTA